MKPFPSTHVEDTASHAYWELSRTYPCRFEPLLFVAHAWTISILVQESATEGCGVCRQHTHRRTRLLQFENQSNGARQDVRPKTPQNTQLHSARNAQFHFTTLRARETASPLVSRSLR